MCKCVIPEKVLKIVQRFQKIEKVYQQFASKHHYLTKFWNVFMLIYPHLRSQLKDYAFYTNYK